MNRLADLLPRQMREDEFLMRLVAVFDELLNTVAVPVDNLALLAHPALAPDPMVDWLCSWLGWDLPPGWPSMNAKRRFLDAAGELLTYRGTEHGIRRLVEVLGGSEVSAVEVLEPGFVVVNDGSALPAPVGDIEIRISGSLVDTWPEHDLAHLERLVLGDVVAGHRAAVTFLRAEPPTPPTPDRR
jgi:phage tail-like protein